MVNRLPIPQRNFPVAVVDDVGHEVFGVFLGGGELLGDVVEAVFAWLDTEFLQDVAGAVNVEVATAVEGAVAEVPVWIVAAAEGNELFIGPGDLEGAFPLPEARVADLGTYQVGRFVEVTADLLAVGGRVYFRVVGPVGRHHVGAIDQQILDI